MSGYAYFAAYYDALTHNVGYLQQADYLEQLFARLGHQPGIVLDLACGTGSLTLELARRGLDVYGVDGSAQMLSVAQDKAAQEGLSVLFICQPMQRLDLFGTVNTVLCTLDSVNHLTRQEDVKRAFERVALFLEPGGYFIFDVNSVYKHQQVLGNHTFVYDTPGVFCVWQNTLTAKTNRVGIHLDFFVKEEAGLYRRQQEDFAERAYSDEVLTQLLTSAGLQVRQRFDGYSFHPVSPQSERVLYVAQKPGL